MEKFTDSQRKFLALCWYDAEVCNGGHDQFFSNSTGIVWQDALEGMKMIGDRADADNFQKAIDYFGGSVPFDRGERNDVLEKLYQAEDFNDFEEIDRNYYGGEQFDRLINEYIRSHAAEFTINGDFQYCENIV